VHSSLGDIDIWRTAKLLIDSHGEDAWLEASQRADHALEDKNSDGEVWKRVIEAIDDCSVRSQLP
jgi:hypothetical protein